MYEMKILVNTNDMRFYAEFSDSDGICLQGEVNNGWIMNAEKFTEDRVPDVVRVLIEGLNFAFPRIYLKETVTLHDKNIFTYAGIINYKMYKSARSWFNFKSSDLKQRSKVSTYIASYLTWNWQVTPKSEWTNEDADRVDEEYLNMTDEEFKEFVRKGNEAQKDYQSEAEFFDSLRDNGADKAWDAECNRWYAENGW